MPRMRLAARSGMERLQRVELLAHADELQRLPGDVADRKRRAAAGIAVHLGQDHAGDAEALVELVGDLHGVLAGHGVGDEQDLDRVELLLQLLQLRHQLVVDVQAAGGIHQQHVAAGLHGFALRAERARSSGCCLVRRALVDRQARRRARSRCNCSRAAGR